MIRKKQYILTKEDTNAETTTFRYSFVNQDATTTEREAEPDCNSQSRSTRKNDKDYIKSKC